MRWLLALILSLTLVPAAAAAVPNACTLLTPAQVESAVGGKPKSRNGFSSRGASVCIWTSPANAKWSLQLLQMTKADFKKGLSDEPEARTLRGIGELAYVLSDGRVLVVWHQGVAITVAFDTQASVPKAKRVARAAIARL